MFQRYLPTEKKGDEEKNKQFVDEVEYDILKKLAKVRSELSSEAKGRGRSRRHIQKV